MKELSFIFDYNNGLLTIIDKGERTDWHIPSTDYPKEDPANRLFLFRVRDKKTRQFKISKKSIHYDKNYPLAIVNSLLYKAYPYKGDTFVDLFSQFANPSDENDRKNEYMKGEINKAVNHINDNVLKKYPQLQIQRKKANTPIKQWLYYFSPAINEYIINWTIINSDPFEIEKYGIDDTWVSETKQNDIDDIASYNKNIVMDDKQYEVKSIEDKSIWEDRLWASLLSQYSQRVADIDEALLPKVKAADIMEPVNLPDYYCNTYIKRSKEPSDGNSFAIVDGGSGFGKTYSLYETARRLLSEGHRALLVELPDLYSNKGKKSLFSFICQFVSGNEDEDEEFRIRDLLSDPENKIKNKSSKTVFIFDGIDEINTVRVESFVRDLDKLAAVSNPNVLFLLSARNAEDFIRESSIGNGGTEFKRWDNISMQPLDVNDLPPFDNDISEILRNNPITRTPLFVSYYREIRKYYTNDNVDSVVQKTSDLSNSILENYVDDIDAGRIKRINNYYDLFNVRTELLCAHARKNNGNPIWFTAILPCLAYYMYTNTVRFFDADTIERLFSEESFGKEYQWFNERLKNEYSAFKVMFAKEKFKQLLGTRIVKSDKDKYGCSVYTFEHKEYMQFLAAKFASVLIRKIDDLSLRERVLTEIDKMTSFYREDRADKMGHIPYARYVFIDVMRNEPIVNQSVKVKGRRKQSTDGLEDFDPVLYRIAANVSYEGRDVYDEASKLTALYMEYLDKRVTKRSNTSNTREIQKLDDWKLLDAANVLSYTMLTRRNKDPRKWQMLGTIYSDLCGCASLILRNALFEMENRSKSNRRGLNKSFPYSKEKLISGIEDLTELVCNSETPVLDIGGIPIDLLARLFSNLGATCQEQAKYVNTHKDMEGADDKMEYLRSAIEFHHHTFAFREAVIQSIDNYIEKSDSFSKDRLKVEKPYLNELVNSREKISVIRSLITLAGDSYYSGLFSNEYDDAREHLLKAVEYHNKALYRQGIDSEQFKTYTYERTLEILERAHVDSESYVICLRAAGAYYLLYKKTKQQLHIAEEKSKNNVRQLKEDLRNYIYNQFLYLRAAYNYLYEECSVYDEKSKERILDSIKLEINTKEIDSLFNDCENKYVHSFPLLEDSIKGEGIELLEKIIDLYKALHVYSDVKYLYTASGDYFVIRRYERNQIYNIKFPPYEDNRKERINKLIHSAEEWSRSKQIEDLLWVFGRKIDKSLPFKEYIQELNKLVEDWDFRGRKSSLTGKVDVERYELEDEEFWSKNFPELYKTISYNKDLIISASVTLGMDDLGEIIGNPDYILPVGGARMVNLYRPMMARKLIDDNDWSNTTVVAIGASRLLIKEETNESGRKLEWYYIKQYASDAYTEYDALVTGMCKAFDSSDYTEYEYSDVPPTDVEWKSLRVWDEYYKNCRLTAISAPSITNLPGRANSYDGFLHFIRKYDLVPEIKVAMVTTNIYRQYQGLSFMDIGMDKGLDFSVIGTDRSIEDTDFGGNPIKFLQELKATVNLIYKFVNPNPDYHKDEFGLSPSYIEDVKQVMEEKYS